MPGKHPRSCGRPGKGCSAAWLCPDSRPGASQWGWPFTSFGSVCWSLSRPRWRGEKARISAFPFPALLSFGSWATPSLGPGDSMPSVPGSLEQKRREPQALRAWARPRPQAGKLSHDCSHPPGGQREPFLLPAQQLHRHPPSPSVTSGSLSSCAHSCLFPGSTLLAAGSICLLCCPVFPGLWAPHSFPFLWLFLNIAAQGLI